jgi:hypothetical protein
MISFEVSDKPDGATIATLDGTTRIGTDPCRAIARVLVDAGTPDQPWEMRRRCYQPSWSSNARSQRNGSERPIQIHETLLNDRMIRWPGRLSAGLSRLSPLLVYPEYGGRS